MLILMGSTENSVMVDPLRVVPNIAPQGESERREGSMDISKQKFCQRLHGVGPHITFGTQHD
jgi:hypothetical protein